MKQEIRAQKQLLTDENVPLLCYGCHDLCLFFSFQPIKDNDFFLAANGNPNLIVLHIPIFREPNANIHNF